MSVLYVSRETFFTYSMMYHFLCSTRFDVSRETPYFSNKGSIAVADQLKTYYNDYGVKNRISLALACDW